MLRPMSATADFLSQGLAQARDAVISIMVQANLQLRPETLPRTHKRRALGRLRQIEMIIRRLLVLLAFSLKLSPLKPRKPAPRTQKPELPEGAILIDLPMPYRFALSPPILSYLPVHGFDGYRCQLGPALAAPLIARITALQRVLADPQAFATRLARILERQKKARRPRPVILPIGHTFRLKPELGLVASVLPGLLRLAFEDWDDTS